MTKNNLISNLKSLKSQSTSHSVGEKFVFFEDRDLQSLVTQIAIGTLKGGEKIPFHSHKSMEEIFYILAGNGIFYLDNEQFHVTRNCCIRVPVGVNHSIQAVVDLKFYYFGVALKYTL
jgi:mannose-6-phosphate isomerase-like protein (cupin superfamily)